MADTAFDIDRPQTKTMSKRIEAGKWRVGWDSAYKVEAARLIDIRQRKWNLLEVDLPTWKSMHMRRPDGEIDERAMIKGMPTHFACEGPHIVLWPSPLHSWEIEVDLVRRKASVPGVKIEG